MAAVMGYLYRLSYKPSFSHDWRTAMPWTHSNVSLAQYYGTKLNNIGTPVAESVESISFVILWHHPRTIELWVESNTTPWLPTLKFRSIGR